jgi:hypothetical protein
MNESKKKKATSPLQDIPTSPEDVQAKELVPTIETTAKAPVKKKTTENKEPKKVQPRKFKTHSEKKEFKKNEGNKKK